MGEPFIKKRKFYEIDIDIERKTLQDSKKKIESIFSESHDLKIDFASFETLKEEVNKIKNTIEGLQANNLKRIRYEDPAEGMIDIYPSVQKMFDNLEVQFLDGSIEKGFENIFKKVKVQPVISGQILSNEPVYDSGYIQDDPYPVKPSKQPDAEKDFPGDISQAEAYLKKL